MAEDYSMSNYKRSTRVCTLAELQPTLQQALRAHFLEHMLTDVEAQIQICCETISERQKKTSALATLLGEDRDLVYYLAAFLTPEWLVWARSGDHTTTTVVAARLTDIHVKLRASVLSKDIGIDIEGFVDGFLYKIHGHIALGPEPAAEEFSKVVEQAVKAVNPPRHLLDLFGKRPR
jgi:hypothetical protein